MPIYLSILKDIGISTVVLYDLDSNKENPWNTEVNRSIEELSTRQHPFEENIECFLGIEKPKGKDSNFKTVISPMEIHMLFLDKNQKLRELLFEIKALIEEALKE